MVGDLNLGGEESQIFEVGIEVSADHFLIFASHNLCINHAVSSILSFVVIITNGMNNFGLIGFQTDILFDPIDQSSSQVIDLNDSQSINFIKFIVNSIYFLLQKKDSHVWVKSF